MNSSVHSPFRYAGGKYYARKLILEHIPPHATYIEPFSGGASIFFAKPKAENNHLNDKDSELINVYETIRDNLDVLVLGLKYSAAWKGIIPKRHINGLRYGDVIPATKELHGFFKKEYIPSNRIERALRWFYLNRTSYSGIMNMQNMYWGYGDKYSMQPKNWPLTLTNASKKLQGVKLTCMDFESIIDSAPDGAFLFVDPPYLNADQDKFYTCAFIHDDHMRLKKCLHRNNDRLLIFVTYDNSDEIINMYSWMEVHFKEWNYCIQRTDDQKRRTNRKGERYKGRELFLLNYSMGGNQFRFFD